ncbi:MAG: hypothetical protein Q9178_003650 [Gyalolechia marmorata]
MASSPEISPVSGTVNDLEAVGTKDHVPGHHDNYEKDGLRTYGDDEDHDHEPPMSFNRIMSLVAMAFLWTGSQIPVYLFGGVPPYIYRDIGGADRWIWFILANLLALAAICPFVGSLSDLMGRRWVAIVGAAFIVLGMIISSTANTMNTFICGMTFAGIGAGINELTALAVTSELAPTRKRGKYIAILVFTILPFCPSVLWAQLIASRHGWRYCGALCGAWAAFGLIMTLVFYFPPPRVNSRGFSKIQILKRVDFVGGFLSVSGMLLFMAGLQWGGYQKFAQFPMFPARLKQNPRILILTLVITFISGANFFSVLLFWPTQAYNVYGQDPIGVGVRGLPIGFSILVGAFVVLWLLSVLRGHNRELMIGSSVFMTAGIGALACARADNLGTLWGLLVIASLGIGGIVVPASIITTIICPDDLIATVAALTLAIRVIGGAIGYTTYYNVFVNKFVTNAEHYIGGAMVTRLDITSVPVITHAIELTGASLLPELRLLPGIQGSEIAYQTVVKAGQIAFAESYRWVYLVSIAFGGISIIASCFLGNIDEYMDDHVAVVMH